jgi:hypothetical protein
MWKDFSVDKCRSRRREIQGAAKIQDAANFKTLLKKPVAKLPSFDLVDLKFVAQSLQPTARAGAYRSCTAADLS